MGYLKKSLVSVSWVSAFRITSRILSFIRTIIIARLLTPAQFGDFGIAAMVLAFAEIFTETGINVFLVQQDDDDAVHQYLNTAWTISMIRGFIIAFFVALASIPVSNFFHNEASQQLILLIALVPLIRGFINPAIAQFQKQLQFNQEFFFRTLITIADAIAAIIIIYYYQSPIGLIAGLIVGALVEVIASFIWVHPFPKLVAQKQQVKDILHSGKWVTTAGIAAYFAGKGPDISIGKLISTDSLGIYQMAYKFSVMFVDELVEMVNRVAFPVYTKIGGDRRRLRSAFLKTYAGFVAIIIPLMILVYFLAPVIVSVFLGPNWASAVPVIQTLTFFGISIAFLVPTNPLFLAVKKQNYLSMAVIFQCICLLIGIVYAYTTGIDMHKIIIAATLAQFATVPLRGYLAYRIFSS
jgi:O-antigen/teichoic acid export membrane protein